MGYFYGVGSILNMNRFLLSWERNNQPRLNFLLYSQTSSDWLCDTATIKVNAYLGWRWSRQIERHQVRVFANNENPGCFGIFQTITAVKQMPCVVSFHSSPHAGFVRRTDVSSSMEPKYPYFYYIVFYTKCQHYSERKRTI